MYHWSDAVILQKCKLRSWGHTDDLGVEEAGLQLLILTPFWKQVTRVRQMRSPEGLAMALAPPLPFLPP